MKIGEFVQFAADAAMGLDRSGLIVAWNERARQLLGWSEAEVTGKPCHEVLACRDSQGLPLCRGNCPVLHTPPERYGTPATPFVARHRSGCHLRFVRTSLALPEGGPHHVAVLIHTDADSVFHPTPASQTTSPFDKKIEDIFERLLIASGAKAAELFVTFPTNPERLVLAAHRGDARRAFCARTEFERGVGFPGITAINGPIVCSDLRRDYRYLRRQVQEKGFRMCIAVPVPGPERALGSLLVTWSGAGTQEAEADRRLTLLEEVAGQLSLLLQVERFNIVRRAWAAALEAPVPYAAPAHEVASQVLKTLAGAADADAATFCAAPSPFGSLPTAHEGIASDRIAKKIAGACVPAGCPLAALGGGFFRPDPDGQGLRPPCAAALGHWPRALCLPLQAHHQTLGAALLLYNGINFVPGRHVIALHELHRWAAESLYHTLVGSTLISEPTSARRPDSIVGARVRRPRLADPPLAVYALGRFLALRRGEPLDVRDFERRRAQEIFKILLTRYGEVVDRETLMDLLWSGEPPRTAPRLVNIAVCYLRRALGAGSAEAEPEYVLTQDGGYAFNVDAPHFFDAAAFLQACADFGRALEQGDDSSALIRGATAIELYRGDYLEDELYADWAFSQRERLRALLLETLKRLAEVYLRTGDCDGAIGALEQALAIDEAQEDAHRRLMEIYWQTGRRDRAIRQYQICRRALARALDVDPQAETDLLLRKIRSTGPVR